MASRTLAPPHRRTAVLVLAGSALVLLAGCGDGDDSQPAPTPAVTSPSPSPSSTPAGATGAPSPDGQALGRAGAAAVAAVPGGTLVSIETEHDGTWEAQVVTPDGVEHHVDVSPDGATVLGAPRVDEEDESDRAKHRERVQAAVLDYAAAADAVRAEVPGGAVTELDLDSDNGVTVWEADVIDGSGTKHEVTIDAATGQVLANTTGR
ncbi:PepSY domain-containing protein [Rhodococcus sp. SGAir0479]|uniref:PepSY domain-containing protein n=1 Tax=Rhodococcus sp. SGAir0479 TaxID=2567884 RepID=UPI0010CCC969|nr:PepSY domain-containing protein [Rhodococcus sp. SGAir0479]QCQ92068.1 metallopeptidase [Rhodococcus sp. SGAir0479]